LWIADPSCILQHVSPRDRSGETQEKRKMAQKQFVAVRCKLSRGLFSSERAFELTLADGEQYSGPAPLHFCWTQDGRPLGKGEAVEGEIDGWVAARRLGRALPGDQVAVEVPDGAAVAVRQSQIHDAWTDVLPPAVASA
jgi:hypothetical protein